MAVNVSLGFVLIRQSSAAMRTLIENRMLDVSNTAAAMLDGDVLETLEADDRDTPEYQNVYRTLRCFEENIELEYIYCVRALGDGEFVFMIDPDAESPGEFGEHIAFTDALYQASLGTPSVDKQPYEDSWGRFYSAYTPVFDSAHRVAGIVAVDFSAEWYENQISNQVRTTLLVSGISLFFAAVIIALITTRYRSRFHRMMGEMNVVSDGIETLVHEISPGLAMNLRRDDGDSSKDDMTALGDRILSLETQLGEQISYVRSQAYVDGLTGLGNRTAYKEHTRRLDDDIGAGQAAFAVAVVDLNGLKEINDRLGHDKGDEAIISVAVALRETLAEAKLYRIGGDEFTAILEGDSPDIATRLNGIDEALSRKGDISVAKGCATFTPDADVDYSEVFKRADNAMYDDKKQYYLTHGDRRRS